MKKPSDDSCCDVMLDDLASAKGDALNGTVAKPSQPAACMDTEGSPTCSVSGADSIGGGRERKQREREEDTDRERKIDTVVERERE